MDEAALDLNQDGADLAAGTVTGSTPASTAETTTGTLTFSDPDAPVTVTGVAAGNAGSDVSGNVGTNVTGIYGLLHDQRRRQLHLHADQAVRHDAGRRQRRQHGAGA